MQNQLSKHTAGLHFTLLFYIRPHPQEVVYICPGKLVQTFPTNICDKVRCIDKQLNVSNSEVRMRAAGLFTY